MVLQCSVWYTASVLKWNVVHFCVFLNFSVVQCSVVKWSVVLYTVVQFNCFTAQCYAVQCCVVKGSVVQISVMQCSIMLHSAVYRMTVVLQGDMATSFVFPGNDPGILKSRDTVVSTLDHVMPFCLISWHLDVTVFHHSFCDTVSSDKTKKNSRTLINVLSVLLCFL